jgi:uncharacterized protein (TIGR00661 family)
MRILYGVVGEGMGHAIRSRVVLEHLFEQGHEVEMIASGRAADFLRKRMAEHGWVHRIHGLHIAYEDNRVDKSATFWSNVIAGTAAIPRQIAAYLELASEFRPELVISDFESWTYYFAKRHGLPILSIDNMQVLNRCSIDEDVIEGYRSEFELAKAFVKSKLPFCDHYLIATFFRLPVRKPDTTLFPPILRPEILAARASDGDHLLVYQTAEGHDTLVETLQRTGLECRVYGMRRDIHEEQTEGNLRYKPFDEASFVTDLATARGVIAGGGFTLMGEAVYLHKPMLAVPIRGQFEQLLNARYLEKLGFGRAALTLEDPSAILSFVAELPRYQEQLAAYQQDGNRALLAALDEHLARLGAPR